MIGNPLPSEYGRFRRRLARNVACGIIQAMRERDMSFEDIDTRLGNKPRTAFKFVVKLMNGDSMSLGLISDMMLALGAEITVQLHEIEYETPEEET